MKSADWVVTYGILHSAELSLHVTLIGSLEHDSKAALIDPLCLDISVAELSRHLGGRLVSIKDIVRGSEVRCLHS